MSNFKIRRAGPADVESIRAVHRQSILDLAAKDYPPEVVAVWGVNRTPESMQKQRDAISRGEQLVWVAEIAGQVEGFAVLDPIKKRLGAIYITGAVAGKGMGKALLEILEAEAKRMGIGSLTLDSSITARAFYERHGYKNLGRGFHEMRSGLKMECYFMEKELN